MASLEQLGAEYLITPDGRTPDNPCGTWCGDGDVTIWVTVVRRVRDDLVRLLKANASGVVLEPELQASIAQWLFRAMRFRAGNLTHVFGAGTDEVYSLVAFARRGVQLMFEAQEAIEQQGGNVPQPGPRPAGPGELDIFPGPDAVWWLGFGALGVLLLLQLWRSR